MIDKDDWPKGIDYLSPKIKSHIENAKLKALFANAPGLLEMATTNLVDRPGLPSPDRGYGNIFTGTFGIEGGKTALLPTIINGIKYSPKEAFEHFKNTGEHAGIFASKEQADAFDKLLHEHMGWIGKRNKWEK